MFKVAIWMGQFCLINVETGEVQFASKQEIEDFLDQKENEG